MKHVFLVMCTAIALSIGVARCGSMGSVRDRAQSGACETGCQQTCDKCTSECSGTNPDGTAKDSAGCKLACTEGRDKCNSDCKAH